MKISNAKSRQFVMKTYYVTMIDKFMSGWGCAKGKINRLVIECRDLEDAKIVEENAKNRKEMRRVNIVYRDRPPCYPKATNFVSFKPLGEYPTWHEKGAFPR